MPGAWLTKSKSLEISTSALHIIPINLSQQLPWTTAIFDRVLLIGVLQVLPEPEKTLRALANLLHPGGSVIVVHRCRPAQFIKMLANDSLPLPVRLLKWIKGLADRSSGTRYWTSSELQAMLNNAGLQDLRIMGDDLLIASGIHAGNPGNEL
jgi:SAM-dependent methyltransferase